MSKQVYVTGIGIICAIGDNVEETLQSLLGEKSGIGEITLFKTIHKGIIPMAEVKMTTEALLAETGHAGQKNLTRTTLLGMKAGKEALDSAGITDIAQYKTGLISATTVGGMDRSENFYASYLSDPKKGRMIDIVNHDCGDSTERIAAYLGISEFVTTISTACSSSVNALMFGSNLIKTGKLDRVIVGGTDSVTKFTLNGFNTLMILDKTGCHPFDENRAGLTLGEGSAFLVLESEDVVRKENKTILAEISGYGNANDAYHQTASSPEGTGAFMAMSKAIAASGLKPCDIGYINVHGTGTQNNDLSEGIAMERIFGEAMPPFSSTKGYTGHTLGAAGAVEAVISILSIQHQVIFPNLNFSTPMKELHIRPVVFVEPQLAVPLQHVLSNSFGFGGNNSSIVLSKPFVAQSVGFVPQTNDQLRNTNIYINGLGNVSPQKTINAPLSFLTNQLRCIDPGYKDFVPVEMIRRMGRIIKMGVAASKLCIRDAGIDTDGNTVREICPEAIITGTGLGCMEDTEKFLTSMVQNNEEFLTPTSFIQSTHNTVAGQIALLLKCHGYNFTCVHRGISFESALLDAIVQMQAGEFSNVLVGGFDEITANSFAIASRLGYWKRKPIQTLNLLDDKQRGTIAGEGASFLFLENKKNEHSYARLTGVATFLKPAANIEVSRRLHDFLASFGLKSGDIGLVILGLNGDPRTDKVYHDLIKTDFPVAPLACFKHLCGEYHTASAFATWLGAMVLKTQSVPEVVRVNGPFDQSRIEHVLIYNHFRGNNHSFILLSHS